MKLNATDSSWLPPLGDLVGWPPAKPQSEGWEPLPDVVAQAQTSTVQRWLADIRQPGMIMAGVAIAATTASAAKLLVPPAQYEGNFEIAVSPLSRATTTIPAPQVEDVNQPVAVPTVDSETQAKLLKSPRFLEPVLARLRAQGMEIDFATLRRNLEITPATKSGVLTVRYWDSDRQRVQQVTEQVMQAYVQEGQQCQTQTCLGLEFVETQIPRIQQKVQTLRTDLAAFRARYDINNLEVYGKQLRLYTTELSRQEAATRVELDKTRSQFHLLQERLALKPNEAIAQSLLQRDPQYQALFQQFQTIEKGIAEQFRSPHVSQETLKSLYAAHQQVLAQLRQRGQVVLAQQFAGDRPPVHPVFESTVDAATLQQWFDTATLLQTFQVRQQTIATIQAHLNQQVDQWAAIARRYTDMQQQLQVASESLNLYLNRREAFKADPGAAQVAWRLVTPPSITDPRSPLEAWLARHHVQPEAAAPQG
ncbi:MAG TPA: hypothetical protein IGS37_00285 [Synechococcales cyanobacterium M55_K2018_004]|nr:hypothetical protein [Synechococcales cyanobacterium M55_K2018_004]